MKKAAALFLAVIVAVPFCAAQKKTQTGNATYNEDEPNLRASHADLEMGTRVRVTNKKNNKAVIVTIAGRIPSDPQWILHIGKAGADNIEIPKAGATPVVLEVLGTRRQPSPQANSRNAE
jgi:rare lipoprotein A